jgi:lipopolysaccharide transport system permease protein
VIRHDNGSFYTGTAERGPLGPYLIVWRYRQVLRRLAQRDVEVRFRGSALGKFWAVLAPLFMLVLYTVSFSVIIRPQWQSSVSSATELALIYFSGLIVFDFFFECVNRACTLMIENESYIRKIVFPVEIFAWVVLGGAMFRLFVGTVILSVFYLAARGLPPVNALIIPLLFVLLSVVAVGFVWLLSSLSVFLRDIRHVIIVLMPAFLFLTPVFFPLSAAPPAVQRLLYLNPLTFVLEGIRGALFANAWPSLAGLAAYTVFAGLFCWFAYRLFMKLRTGFADVL